MREFSSDRGICFQEKSANFLHFEPKMEHLECGPFKIAIFRIFTTIKT